MYQRKPSPAILNGEIVDPFARKDYDLERLRQAPPPSLKVAAGRPLDHPSPPQVEGTSQLDAGSVEHDNAVVIGRGVQFKGEVWSCSRLVVAGSVEGAFAASEVVVHEGGSINASVVAERADIRGTMIGQLVAIERVDIRGTGSFHGRLVYGTLSLEPGAVITGNLTKQLDAAEQEAVNSLTAYHPSETGSAAGGVSNESRNGSARTT